MYGIFTLKKKRDQVRLVKPKKIQSILKKKKKKKKKKKTLKVVFCNKKKRTLLHYLFQTASVKEVFDQDLYIVIF
jgi:hypothetical protein